MAIKSFANQSTADLFEGLNTKASRQIPREIWKKAQRTLSMLQAATSTQDLSIPSLRIEPLKWDKPGYFSIRINLIYRVIFRFEEGNAHDVSVESYHGRNQS